MSQGDFHALMTIAVALSTSFACGVWVGWFAGRRHQKSLQSIHRARRRRQITVNVDYEFAVRALNHAGYKVEPMQERPH